MRLILALVITLGLLGGVFGYVRFADSVRRTAVEIEIDYATGDYSIEVQTTFACQSDPILETESLKVMFKGEPVYSSDQRILANEVTLIPSLPGVESGENEIFVTAHMDPGVRGLQAMKVSIKRNDIPVAEKVLISEPGLGTVAGPVTFNIAGAKNSPPPTH